MPKTIRIDEGMVRAALPVRPADGHKGTFGHVLALAGSYGMAGAAMLCAETALRGGAGLVTAAMPVSVYPMVTVAVPEAVCLPLPETEPGCLSLEAAERVVAALPGKSVLVAGCGLGRSSQAERCLEQVLSAASVPVVLDADGLNWLAAHIDKREAVTAPLCLTPHPGEMSRLCDLPIAAVQTDRAGTAKACADRLNAVVVLKGRETVIAIPGSELVMVNSTGNAGMATGGSGDVLAGLIGSLIAQGMPPESAAVCAVYLHGAAGDMAAATHSQRGMLPRDLLEALGPLLLRYE